MIDVRFAQAAARHPDAIAIVTEDRQWTYREVDVAAGRVAAHLKKKGSGLFDFVGICLDRSAEAIIAMLGVFRAGMAFVPLDPDYPADRLAVMVDDAPVRVVLTDRDHIDRAPWPDPVDIRSWIEDVDGPVMEAAAVDPDSLAYAMYTSGSTGKPKGVSITHRALATYCDADCEVYQLTPSDRTLQFSTLNFDIAIEEIFPPLISGGSVAVRPRGRGESANELSEIITRMEVTAVHLATAYWHSWVDLLDATDARVPASLRLVIATGEKVSVPHYRRWLSMCDREVLWCNAYGPTEATVSATVFIPDDAWLAAAIESASQGNGVNMPIGKPLPGYAAYILDQNKQVIAPDFSTDANSIADASSTGQLYLAGPALARDYLHRPELTEKAFSDVMIDGRSIRVYATGDLARWLPSGDIDFAGRVDHQIKLGSYRIEPGEIEAAMNELDCVRESLVRVDEIDGQRTLVAYVIVGDVVGDSGGNPTTAEPAAIAADIADSLRDRLPVYMIPVRYVLLDEFPKTMNGKINRKALPDARLAVSPRRSDQVAPENDAQREMAAIWRDVLHINDIGIDDDFFLLGGSSLLVTQVIARWTRIRGGVIPVRDFFAHPTIRHLVGHLSGDRSGLASTSSPTSTRPDIHAGYFAGATDCLHGVWYHARSSRRHHSVIIDAAWGHEWVRGYRNLQQLAVWLCQRGFDVLRYDHAGIGQSSGDETSHTLDGWMEDLTLAIDRTHERTGNTSVSVLGLRCGGTMIVDRIDDLRAHAIERGYSLEHVVAWDPVASGRDWLAMADRFHAEVLVNQTRYPVRRDAGGDDEVMGMRLGGGRRRRNIESLCWPDAMGESRDDRELQQIDRPDVHVIVSAGQWRPPAMADRWTIHCVADQIGWERADCVESAFSSPQTFQRMTRLLETGLQTRLECVGQ